MTFSSEIKQRVQTGKGGHKWFVLALCFLVLNAWGVWKLVGTAPCRSPVTGVATNGVGTVEPMRLLSASMASNHMVEVSNGFRPGSISAESPSFEPAQVRISFGQDVDLVESAGLIEVQPPAKWELGAYYGGCALSGDFLPGKTYAITFKKGFKAVDGTELATNVTRQVVVPDRNPAIAVAVDGAFLSPRGALNVPVVAMNVRKCEVALRQVCPGNVVFLANGHGNSDQWREGLTAPAMTNAVTLPDTPNRENKFYVNLRALAGPEPKGVYSLSVTHQGQYDWERDGGERLVVVTDLGISAKVAGDGVWVWVNSLRAASAVTNAEVVVYAANNQELGRGVTDARGLVYLPLKENPASELEPTLVTAAFAGDLSYVALRQEGAVVSLEASQGAAYLGKGNEAYVFTDRGVYRPGETVHVKALIRTAALTPPNPFPVLIRVRKPDGKVYRDHPAMLDERGAVECSLELPGYLPTGRYMVQVIMPGSFDVLGALAIALEEFVPPQIVAVLSNLPVRVKTDDAIRAAVNARHLFGRPGAGLRVEAEVHYGDGAFKPAAWAGYRFGDAEKAAQNTRVTLGDARLDEAGHYAYEFNAISKIRPAGAVKATVSVSVSESSGRSVTVDGTTLVDAYPFYVGLKPARSGGHVKVGEKVPVFVAAVKPDEAAIQPESPLLMSVERVEWTSVMKRQSGRYAWQSERVKIKVGEPGQVTLKDGVGEFPVAFDRSGEYLVTVADPLSGSSTSLKFFVSAGDAEWVDWAKDKPAEVQLSLDRTDYLPGDTAKLAVKAPFSGQALLTVESDRVLEQRVVTLAGNTAEFEIAVKPDYAPNVHCVLSLIRPATAESVWSAHRAVGSALLKVVTTGHRLAVGVAVPATIRPQSQLAVKVTAADEAGKGVAGAEVVVMAVDEGICMLTDYETPDPLNFFQRTRGLGVTLADIYGELMPISEDVSDSTVSHTGGDGGDSPRRRLNPIKASRFKPVALWKSGLITDTNGEATVLLDVPELTGELRVTAVAFTRSAYGATKEPVTVKRPLVVQAGLPRFLAPGDRCRMGLAVYNETGAAIEAKWRVTCGGPLTAEQSEGTLALKAGGEATVPVGLVAGDKPGKGLCSIEVSAGAEKYSETFQMAVRPVVAGETRSISGEIKSGASVRIRTPAGWLPGTGYFEAVVTGQPDVRLKGGLDWLLRYPYGCSEQTVSSALPLLYLGDLMERVRAGGLGEVDVGPFVMAGVYRVLSMQVSSGGFALWPDSQKEDRWVSVYATHFLVEARKAGHAVPEDRLEAALAHLRELLERREPANRAYMCHVLALAGRPEQGWVSRLAESAGELSAADRAHLAAALLAGGKPREAVKLLGEFGVPVVTAIPVQASGYESRTRAVALALSVWLDIEPGNEQVARLVQELDGLQVADRDWWGTTQENALALMALGKFARLRRPDRTPFAGELVPAGLAAVPFNSRTNLTWRSAMPGSVSELEVINRGPGSCWYGVRMDGVPAAGEVKEEDSGVAIRREFLKPDGSICGTKTFQQGELVVVRLTLETRGEVLNNLVIEDLLPAGWEVENPALATARTMDWVKAETSWCVHRELRDDRVLLFTGSVAGKVEYFYTVRVVTPGRFVLPPVRVEAMYRPEIHSVSGAGEVVVKD